MTLPVSVFNSWTLPNPSVPDYGLLIKADSEGGTDADYQWKIFDSSDNAASYQPHLDVTYSADVAPQINHTYPQNDYNASSLTPELLASGSDGDGWPDPLTYQFAVMDSSGKVVACSTPSSDGGCSQSSSQFGTGWISSSHWAVPSGDLKWGQVYSWYVEVYDGLEAGVSGQSFLMTQVPQPAVTSAGQNSGAQGITPGSSTYTTSATDAQISTVGPALSIQRYYDSADASKTGAFGVGWSSVLDMKVAPGLVDASGNTDTVNVTYPDGEQVGFGENADGTFTAPQGRYATLAATTSPAGYTLTDKNSTVYTFSQTLGGGAYGITSITDALGNTLAFTWSGSPAEISLMKSASGRSLTIAWAMPANSSIQHVASVTTNDVTDAGSELTWSYAYSGNYLTGVCSPASAASCAAQTACPQGSTGCTAYSYTAGTYFPGALLATGPHSYWRLDEAAGAGAAASAVLANEGTDNGTYSNVSLGQDPGPLPGSAATAAGFNGTSSYVQLPTDLVSGGSFQTVSMWFKTTAGGGVLFSSSKDPVTQPTTSGQYTPNLYLGPGGDLHGEFWNGATSPIQTSSPVNDGNWHFVVLTGAGNTESLYLDGQLVGSLSGLISNSALINDYVGAGFLGGGWPNQDCGQSGNTGCATFFNGDISDVGFWDRPLSGSEVAELYQIGTTALKQLTQVTRPSGSVYSQVAYDTVTGAVTQVTDDNGGTWKLAAPTVAGSSQVYVSSVLGAGPADYWRLADTGTAAAVNQVNGGTATYSNVTQGVPGLFSDSSADSFDGSSSYVNLPSGLVDSGGGQTISLWFKTSTGGGVLFGYANQPLTSSTASDFTPALYLGPGGDLHGEFWDGSSAAPIMTSSSVADGKWHNAVLAAGADTQTLYLDGEKVGTLPGTISNPGPQTYSFVGGGFIGEGWPNEPNQNSPSAPDYYAGDIAEVSFYNSQLSAAQVDAQYQASKSSTGLTPVETAEVTDPGGHTVTYRLDPLNGDRVLSQTDALGNTTRYGYDSDGFQYDVVDPNGNETITGHDVRGNLVSQTTCQNQQQNLCSTAYYTYYPDDTSTNPAPDPRNDLMLTSAGPGSTSASDPAYLTSYTYNSAGQLTSQTGPPVPGFPQGRTTTYAYTTSSTPAYDSSGQQVSGVSPPPGLPWWAQSPGGAKITWKYYSDGDVYQVTDPDGLSTTYTYDGLGRVLTKTVTSDSFPNGLTTTYAYDAMGDVTTETDPPVTDSVTGAIHTAKITTTYDADGDVTSQTVADTTGGDASRTVSRTYNSHDQVATSTDAAGNTTAYTYDAYGNLASVTDPAGNTTGYSYDPDGDLLTATLENYTGIPSGSQAAAPLAESTRTYDPAGRLASVTNAMGFTTAYTYTDNGLLATVNRCSGWTGTGCAGSVFTVEANTYNAAGQLTQRITGNGQTTTDYVPDAAGRDTSVTLDPAGLDRTTAYTYSPDDYVTNETVTGPGSATPAQSTSYTYDPMGNLTSESQYVLNGGNPTGWWRLYQTSGAVVTDASGGGHPGTAANVSWTGSAGQFDGSDSEIDTAGPVLDTTGSFTVSAWVKMATATAWEAAVSQDDNNTASGSYNYSAFQLQYDADTGGWAFSRKNTDTTSSPTGIRATSSGDAATGTWYLLTGTYDGSTGAMTLYVNGAAQGTAADTTPYATTGPLVIGRGQYQSASDWWDGNISDVRVWQRVLPASEVAALYQAGRGSGGSADKLATTWALDQRGLPTSMTDANGNTTYYTYDAAGRLTATTYPAVSVQTYGNSPVQASPMTRTGYDTFGEPTEAEDANGNVVTTAYDADGRPVSVTQPSYSPPDGGAAIPDAATTTTYNSLGEATSQTDPLGNTTSYSYDQLGDVTSRTAPDGGVTSYSYDTNGDQLSVTSPTGAVDTATYDFLGRRITATAQERYPSPAAYTTAYSYGADGSSPWLSSVTSPDGVSTSYGYDVAGETTSVTNGADRTTSYSYDPAGRLTTTTQPDGKYSTTTYDEAGRAVGQADYTASGSQVRSASASYDGLGHLVSWTDYCGDTTTYVYDAMGRLSAETQPVAPSASNSCSMTSPVSGPSAITTSFGYDAAGNQTVYTDGNGSNWWTTYNSWNLPQSRIEPPTAAAPSASEGTFTTSYDANGQPVNLSEPGGVSVASTYNNMGELIGQTGSGADAPTAARSFGYNLDGNLTSASAPGGTDTFTYDDRGLLTGASGPSGSAQMAYNGDGLPTSVTDAAGTTSYSYDSADRLATLADPATGTTLSYAYNSESQVSKITYGSGDVRTFAYNDLHRLISDVLSTSSGAQVASINYTYDHNGNLASKTTSGFGAPAASTYTYDAANRLTSWDNGTSTTTYGYDGAGNRTQAGSAAYTYDARDELLSDGTSSYTWTARGTLASATSAGGTESYSYDAFGQAITQAGQGYAYDALGRVVSETGPGGAASFSYAGLGNNPASDGTSTYTWDPSGSSLAGVGVAGGPQSAGVLAFADQHTDVVGDFTAGASSLAASAVYGPFGALLAVNGAMAGRLGYQSAWTDPATGRVDMWARWYNPAVGQFASADTAHVSPVPGSAAANPFAYAADSPMLAADPTGHMETQSSGGGYCSASCEAQIAQAVRQPRERAAPAPCGWMSFACSAWHDLASGAGDVYHAVVNLSHSALTEVSDFASQALRDLRQAASYAIRAAGRIAYELSVGVDDAVARGIHVLGHAWHATVAATSGVIHAATRWASAQYHAGVNMVSTGLHDVARAATATVNFVKDHAAAIASVVASTAVFFGCDAALGMATGGVGAIAGAAACGALAGAAGNAVSYGITAAQTGHFSWTGLAGAVGEGALAGAATGFLGGLAGEAASGASSLLARGADTATTEAGASAAATGADATGAARTADPAISAAEDTGNTADRSAACVVGGQSFTARTKILTASGTYTAISALKTGQKIAAMDTATGRGQARPVAAVLLHHDQNLYDLRIRASGTTAVIHTTRNHLFWNPAKKHWAKAAALAPGTHLKTPAAHTTATVLAGWTPRHHTAWMWDLTIPTDHDFYIAAGPTAILVHNCNEAPEAGPTLFRGTSEGFAGSPGLQRVGVTPATTDPAVGTIFGTHAEQFGSGVLQIASPGDLAGVKILPGNVLSGLEREVAVDMPPTEFAARAGTTISAASARSILGGMGYSIPGSIGTPAAVQAALESTGRMSAAEIASFIAAAGG